MKDSQEKRGDGGKQRGKARSSALAPASPLQRYVAEIAAHPILSGERERELAVRYRETGDIDAARQLVASNLRFVVKVAGEYKNHGINMMDIIQEGNLGLMHAVKRFDPTKGYRLISYAVWWIKAYIRKHIMDTWSLVRIGTGREQRKLFYNMRAASGKLERGGAAATRGEIAKEVGVSEKGVSEMKQIMGARDMSLNSPVRDGADAAHMDFLADSSEGQDAGFERAQIKSMVKSHMTDALKTLGEKENYIVRNRFLSESPKTLDTIGNKFGISRERVRQIEKTALKKLKKEFEKHGISPPDPR
ncbi:MAG: RNA polymerase factor sigma-32 [Candidatus Dadabacteria bacterium]|nr:RNA polymerase factor sigma-32 [Candidatus Dadabacteria bacterium]